MTEKSTKSYDFLFSVAPMMDWTDPTRKAKRGQHLSVAVLSHAGPNAVPLLSRASISRPFCARAFLWWQERNGA
jgi:hypothetical protein